MSFGSFGRGVTAEESLEISELAMATTAIAYYEGEITLELVTQHLQNELNNERQRVKRLKVKSVSITPEEVELLPANSRVAERSEARELLQLLVEHVEGCMYQAFLQISKRDIHLLAEEYVLEIEGIIGKGEGPEIHFDNTESRKRAVRRARERFNQYLEAALLEAKACAHKDTWPTYDALLVAVQGKRDLHEMLAEIRMLLGIHQHRLD